MLSVKEAIETRRSIRHFRPDDVPDELIPAAVIPVGYAAGEIPPQRPRRNLQEILLKP